jgi:hypothetical protein
MLKAIFPCHSNQDIGCIHSCLQLVRLVRLLPTTHAMSQWFLNLVPKQAGAAATPVCFGEKFKNRRLWYIKCPV